MQYRVMLMDDDGNLQNVPCREMYDYDDSFPFRYARYDTPEEAVSAVKSCRDSLRITTRAELVILPVFQVPL